MKIKQIIESTTTGSVAPVVMAMNGEKVQRRTEESANIRGLQPAEKVIKGKAKKKGPYANSIIENKSKQAGKIKKNNDVTETKIEEMDLIIPAGSKRLKAGFHKHDPDKAEHEGATLKNSLQTIMRVTYHLNKALSERDNFPEWVSEKIGAIKNDIVTVMDYLISDKEMRGELPKYNETGGVIAGGMTFESDDPVNELGYTLADIGLRKNYKGDLVDIHHGLPLGSPWPVGDAEQKFNNLLPDYARWFIQLLEHYNEEYNHTTELTDSSWANDGNPIRASVAAVRTQILKDTKLPSRSWRPHELAEIVKDEAKMLWNKQQKGETTIKHNRRSTDPKEPEQKDLFREGAKVDRMEKHIEKSERKAGKSKEEAERIAWSTLNKRGMLNNKNKKPAKKKKPKAK